ncbi:MAG: MBL fold metallo-hydrolase [Bacteroidetes bacterium]|nr:MBL fold metallo-hydrolase [Bacteroidota bacterium]MCW5895197.1 MBL fold metallo-hydrolase [Bacteroidota bacterium]
MKIGNYELFAIETGTFALDGGAMFGVVPKTMWEKAIAPDEKNRIGMAARALLLVGNGRKILIDDGNGSKFNEKLVSIYKIDNSRNDVLSSLKTHNLTPSDITDVVLTHLHFDHAGGSTFRDSDGIVKPTFPNANYYVQREHWEAANNPTERDKASFFKDDFMPLYEHGLLHFTEGEGEILPGISCRICNGHTTALQAPLISDGVTSMLYVADLMPTIAHVQLAWIMGYDLRPLVTLEEKRRILNEAVEGNWMLFFEHDATVATCRLQRTDKGIVALNPSPLG